MVVSARSDATTAGTTIRRREFIEFLLPCWAPRCSGLVIRDSAEEMKKNRLRTQCGVLLSTNLSAASRRFHIQTPVIQRVGRPVARCRLDDSVQEGLLKASIGNPQEMQPEVHGSGEVAKRAGIPKGRWFLEQFGLDAGESS